MDFLGHSNSCVCLCVCAFAIKQTFTYSLFLIFWDFNFIKSRGENILGLIFQNNMRTVANKHTAVSLIGVFHYFDCVFKSGVGLCKLLGCRFLLYTESSVKMRGVNSRILAPSQDIDAKAASLFPLPCPALWSEEEGVAYGFKHESAAQGLTRKKYLLGEVPHLRILKLSGVPSRVLEQFE